jgi:hypothetical protein
MVGLEVSRISCARVSLPMYNLPEMRPQNAAFWNALQTELERFGVRELPDRLDFERRPVPSEIESDTLFTQVCGYPLQTIYRGQAVLLAAPVYANEYWMGQRIAVCSPPNGVLSRNSGTARIVRWPKSRAMALPSGKVSVSACTASSPSHCRFK